MGEELDKARQNFEDAYKKFNEANMNTFLATTEEEKKEAKKQLQLALDNFNNAFKNFVSYRLKDEE